MPREFLSPAPGAYSGWARPGRRRASSRRPIALLGLGAALSMGRRRRPDAPAGTATDAGGAPLAVPAPSQGRILLNGEGDIVMLAAVYEPGRSRGGHPHAGVHAVAALAGELTVCERDCSPQRFGPGRPTSAAGSST